MDAQVSGPRSLRVAITPARGRVPVRIVFPGSGHIVSGRPGAARAFECDGHGLVLGTDRVVHSRGVMSATVSYPMHLDGSKDGLLARTSGLLGGRTDFVDVPFSIVGRFAAVEFRRGNALLATRTLGGGIEEETSGVTAEEALMIVGACVEGLTIAHGSLLVGIVRVVTPRSCEVLMGRS